MVVREEEEGWCERRRRGRRGGTGGQRRRGEGRRSGARLGFKAGDEGVCSVEKVGNYLCTRRANS